MWKACCTDKEILQEVHKHIDTNQYGIRLTKLRAICMRLGLYGTCQQDHLPESIQEAMMISLLFHKKQMSVIHDCFLTYEPELIQQCKTCCLRHCYFWAAGVNDIWAVDQHNKWLHFGLVLHTAVEPFSGKILWICVWHSNHNPQLILTYFLDDVKEPSHNDPGTENFGIANAQSMLQQWHDAKLISTLQHRWMLHKKNITPEIMWLQLQHQFTPRFEVILEQGLIFHWLFIPWLQEELLACKDHVNNTAKHHNHNKVMLHGIPNLIYKSAGDYGAIDFKVSVKLHLLHI
ncbi:hypothetical protein F5J12DRAFT_905030 [Pisolithus orientalis]|uniref:uncharacterized protein n=1 Tax=Pisolithus orientalis TaxID=936130 RepID=UPI002224DAA9|nr:uncharacterized protein F5J12DRAFT_905030 [Pisolithus orientalis]KAI6009437.1 hypothetical protein F5J12DRAFT_905030 [Pisolithus orientalis]